MKIVIIISLLFLSISTKAQNIDSGLVAFYPFCGDALDYSINTNDGVTYGATLTTDRNGNSNQAYSFDGIDDYINCGNDISLNGAFDGLTVSAWIYREPGGSFDQHIFGKWNNNTQEDHFVVRLVNNKIIVAVGNFSISAPGFINNQITLGTNKWYHIVFTWDNTGRHKIYIDKVMDCNAVNSNFSTLPTYSPVNLHIGRQVLPTPHNRAFKGKLDELRIYSRALTQTEIDAIYEMDDCRFLSTNFVEPTKDRVSIFPNPTSNIAHINIEKNNESEVFEITLHNAQGQQVAEPIFTSASETSINIENLPKGIYLVAIKNKKNFTTTKKIIVQ